MKDRYFNYKGPKRLEEILHATECTLDADANNTSVYQLAITDFATLEDAQNNEITFLSNLKYQDHLTRTNAAACIVANDFQRENLPASLILLRSTNPYYSFAKLTNLFYTEHPPSHINIVKSSVIADEATVGHNVIMEEGVTIGEGTTVESNAVIKRGVKIGKNCRIGANVTLQCCTIGDNVVIGPGTRIGQTGFGFATHSGKHHRIFHKGSVIISSDVVIGSNTTVDRGSARDTVIEQGVMIGNQVQIAHNVHIGRGCVIVCQTGISGSSVLGMYCVLGGQVGVSGHLKLEDFTQAAARSGIIKNTKKGQRVGGYPAIDIEAWHRQTIFLKNTVK